VLDADTAASLLYVTAYRHDSGAKEAQPPRIRAPYLLLGVPGRLRRTEAGWKILHMEMNREFEFEV
jgi:hypothetical protein